MMAVRAHFEGIVLDGLFEFPLVSAGFTGVLVCGHVQHLAKKQRAGMTCIQVCQPPSALQRIFSDVNERCITITAAPHA